MWVLFNSRSTSWNPVERFIFPAPLPSYNLQSFPEELILIPRADGEKVPCLLLPFRHARFLIIYFHANAEDLGLCYSFCKIMRDLFQVHVLAVEYPGYGVCAAGKTDEEGIMAHATAAMRFALDELKWPCDGIKLFGRSIGTGPAVQLALQYEVAGLILVTPFTCVKEMAWHIAGPLAVVVEDRFRNCDLAPKIESPTLIIHGQLDTFCPIEHGKKIYELLKTRKMMVCPAAMSHNTSLLKSIGTFVLPMTQFFSLPDYTFEDIEVPAWVYPERPAGDGPHRSEASVNAQVGQEPMHTDCSFLRAAPSGATRGIAPQQPRQPILALASETSEEVVDMPAAPLATPQPAQQGGRSNSAGPAIATAPGEEPEGPAVQLPLLSPREGNAVCGPRGFKVSRRYTFAKSTAGSAGAGIDVGSCIAKHGAGKEGGDAATDSLPQDLLMAIDDRISSMMAGGQAPAGRTGRPQLRPPPARDAPPPQPPPTQQQLLLHQQALQGCTPRLTNLISAKSVQPEEGLSKAPGSALGPVPYPL